MVHSSMPTRWRLKEFLDSHGVTVYKLAQETKGKVSRNSLYNLTGEPSGINFDTLDALIPALEKLTGKRVELSDILEYERNT